MPTPPFQHQPLFPHDPAHPNPTPWRRLDGLSAGVRTVEVLGQKGIQVDSAVLSALAAEALRDVSHLFRPGHLAQLRAILDDPEASANDRFVAHSLLKNAVVSAGFVLPSCQDTGTAIVVAKKGQYVFTEGDDEAALSAGVHRTYTEGNLRYSQLAPLTSFDEKNTGTNLPAQVDLYHAPGAAYELLFITKGGGSANKTFLYQQTKALLNPTALRAFLKAELPKLGTAACPPYHLALVIGGLSAEQTLKTVKMASCRELDDLPRQGGPLGHAFRDVALEAEVLKITQELGIGAQFGGKYFCHDVRVIRLPRHGASCPVGLGVSCSADRQVKARIDATGVYLEALERAPDQHLPPVDPAELSAEVVHLDLSRPMDELRAELSRYPIKTRLSLSGPMVVARDIAHARLKDRLDAGEVLPDYFRKYPVYYAGPAKTPDGLPSGAFGPTTASRMDLYVDDFQKQGCSMVMIAKGNRSRAVTQACKANGGFYLGSIGGQAAVLAQENITKVEVLDMPELGMEAVWLIEVKDFPAFIVVDDKGNDFFA